MKWLIALLAFLSSCSMAPLRTYECGVSFENEGGKEYIRTHTEAEDIGEAIRLLDQRFPDHTSICCGQGAECATPTWTEWYKKK